MVPKISKHNRVNNISLILRELLKTSKMGGSTLGELADLCGVSRRNIYRYLNEIEAMGFELVRPSNLKATKNVKGRYKLSNKEPQFFQANIDLLMLSALYMQKEKQYREELNLIYEVLVKLLVLKNKTLLPK